MDFTNLSPLITANQPMVVRPKRSGWTNILLGLLIASSWAPATAENENITKAKTEYRSHFYEDAAADFGAALPSDFNNPYLHYYIANCMVHLRHKEAAIREYRIAFALQPDGKLGQYCKMCLDRFGIDAEGRKVRSQQEPLKVEAKTPAPSLPDPPNAAEIAALQRTTTKVEKSESEQQRDKSVHNLQDLMELKKNPTGAPILEPIGTNLYVRRYSKPLLNATAAGAPAVQPGARQAANGAAPTSNANPQKPRPKLLWW